jgi:hypothetical protein
MDCHIVNVNGCDIDSWPYYFGDKVRRNERRISNWRGGRGTNQK